MVLVAAASAAGMLLTSILTAKEMLTSASVNSRVASTLLSVLTSLEHLIVDLPGETRDRNAPVMLELDSIVNEIIKGTAATLKRAGSGSKFSRLCSFLFARATNLKLLSLVQRLNLLVSTLHLSSSLQERERKTIQETLAAVNFTDVSMGDLGDDVLLRNDIKGEVEQLVKLQQLRSAHGNLSPMSSPGSSKDNSDYMSKEGLRSVFIKQVFSKAHSALDEASGLESEKKALDDLTSVVAFLEEQESAEIPEEDLAFGKLLGKGGFGYVIKAEWAGTPVAVKVITSSLQGSLTMSSVLEFGAELNTWKELNHPNVVRLLGTSFNKEKQVISFVMELCEASLSTLLHDSLDIAVDNKLVLDVSTGVMRGVKYLHSKNVIHRDIKPKNVLLNWVGNAWQAKLCDFGMTLAKEESVSKTMGVAMGGTPMYMAPELLQVPSYLSFKSDIFSFAILLWEMLERKHPFEGVSLNAVLAAALTGQRPDYMESEKFYAWLYELMEACWKQDRALRPTASEVLRALNDRKWPLPVEGQDTTSVIPDPAVVQLTIADPGTDTLSKTPATDETPQSQGQLLRLKTGTPNGSGSSKAITPLPAGEPEQVKPTLEDPSEENIEHKKSSWMDNKLLRTSAILLVIGLLVLGVGLGVGLAGSPPPPAQQVNRTTCSYPNNDPNGPFCSLSVPWVCAAEGCSVTFGELSFPLVRFKNGEAIANPNFTSCSDRLSQAATESGPLSEAQLLELLKDLSFRQRACPLPVGSLGLAFERRFLVEVFQDSLRGLATRVSASLDVFSNAFRLVEVNVVDDTTVYSIVQSATGRVIGAPTQRSLGKEIQVFDQGNVDVGFSTQFFVYKLAEEPTRLRLGVIQSGRTTLRRLQEVGSDLVVCVDATSKDSLMVVEPDINQSSNCDIEVLQLNLDARDNVDIVFSPAPTPTAAPTVFTAAPTYVTPAPTTNPTSKPTSEPTAAPSELPTPLATESPSRQTRAPTTLVPTTAPTTFSPTRSDATIAPTRQPTTVTPTGSPSRSPSRSPSSNPTALPTSQPTAQPTIEPSFRPTDQPTGSPTLSTQAPSRSPTRFPTDFPTSLTPTSQPTVSTSSPTVGPTGSPTAVPTRNPTVGPSVQTSAPSRSPTGTPSSAPTSRPSFGTSSPTSLPSVQPSSSPSAVPSAQPTTLAPTAVTANPSASPSSAPIRAPTRAPSNGPTSGPTHGPTRVPTRAPSHGPTSVPSRGPTNPPTDAPTSTASPTADPTAIPSPLPTSVAPSLVPATTVPTPNPTAEVATTSPRVPTLSPTLTPSVELQLG